MTERITQPEQHDVLCGRGGATNNHVGNKIYRTIVCDHQSQYLHAKKRDKAGIARIIVGIIRSRGGRFLKKLNDGTERWVDVGDKKATEKTSQALREGLDIRRTEEVQGVFNRPSPSGDSPTKKRRRTIDPISVADTNQIYSTGTMSNRIVSPSLVSEASAGPAAPPAIEDISLFVLNEEDEAIFFEPPAPSADDATDLAAV